MESTEIDVVCDEKLDRIEGMLENLLLTTILNVLNQLHKKQQRLPLPLCYNTDCQSRDNIPF